MKARCPSCGTSFTTDRGVVSHIRSGPDAATDEQVRMAHESLAAAEYEVPLPLMHAEPISQYGDPQTLPGILEGIMGSLRKNWMGTS